MPSDRLFLIWGHSHLLGSGLWGWLNGSKQRLKDALLGYDRYSAYDLSERGLRGAAEALLEFEPAYVIAYAAALDRFARVNERHQAAFHRLGLKVAIATAESFPRPDSADFIAGVLGCPVAMEYGAIETGLIAHQRPDGRYVTFWRHSFLEGHESEHLPGAYEILVTSLYPRCFPLLRYRVGDLISANPNDEHFTQTFESVTGRCNDLIVLRNGGVVHSEAFSHAVKEMSSIAGYQVVQSYDGDITLNYVAREPLGPPEMEELRRRLNRINPDLTSIRVARVESLEQTIAGKTRRIFRQ
jgi:phenylacetate-CoA ligase